MPNRLDVNLILAHNLRFFMDRSELYKNANALALAAGTSPNTVRNYLDHKKRTVTTEKAEGFPTTDRLASLASKLECEVWELLHPNIERSIREREMYAKMEADFAISTKTATGAIKPFGVETDWPANQRPSSSKHRK